MQTAIKVNKWTQDRVCVDQFEPIECDIPSPKEGQFLVRVLYLSMDPSQRSYVHEVPSFWKRVPPGEVMAGRGFGQVVASRAEGVAEGDLIVGPVGWREFAVLTPGDIQFRADTSIAPPEAWMSVLGSTGVTAWCGITQVLDVQPGDTVLISTAAGAVGSVAVRLAKLRGARVIGLTSRDDKLRYLKEDLSCDVAINYRTSRDLASDVKDAAPDGINAFFDMVGGAQLKIGFANMATRGRIAICGTISQPNSEADLPGVMHERTILVKRLHIKGFLVADFAAQAGDARRELAHWLRVGEIVPRVDILDGVARAPEGLVRVLDGQNIGQQLVQIAEPEL